MSTMERRVDRERLMENELGSAILLGFALFALAASWWFWLGHRL
ncbi:MAG: hypothetical protein ACRELY_29395 [Polyangiaceae bacterium]